MTDLSRAALLLLTACLPACAAQGDFPSLSPRAVERDLAGGSGPALCPGVAAPVAAPVAQRPTPPPADPALRGRVAELIGAARAGQIEFGSLLPGAERAVAEAGPAESETWVTAQQEISRLGAARARTSDALAELDTLSVRRSADRTINAEDFQAVLQAEAEARALAEQQAATLSRLQAPLGTP